MRLRIDLNGYGPGKGTHVSVFFQLMKGEFDDILEWPFDKLVTVVIIHPDDKYKYDKFVLEDAVKYKGNPLRSFQKPVKNQNEALGFAKIISHKKLHADDFVKNDKLYLRCVIG